MPEGIISSLPAQYGALGVLVVVSLAANVAQWLRSCKLQDEYFEQNLQTKAVLVELVTLVRDRRR